jgi:hypothetical protein
VLYTKTSGSFQIVEIQVGPGPWTKGSGKFTEDFNRLDIPVMLGFKLFKFLRLHAGPVASIDMDSDLRDANNTIQDVDYEKATLGYQAGIGLDIGNFILDAKYESSLSTITKNIGRFDTDQRINQFILSVGFKLF